VAVPSSLHLLPAPPPRLVSALRLSALLDRSPKKRGVVLTLLVITGPLAAATNDGKTAARRKASDAKERATRMVEAAGQLNGSDW
jgi:hypothetical protein